MSLQINGQRIIRVLLADGWHDAEGFGTDAYEFGAYYLDREWGQNGSARFHLEHGGGDSGVCATGFVFHDTETGQQIAGPLTAILAVAGTDLCAEPKPDDPDFPR
jgi:hypothetical protein